MLSDRSQRLGSAVQVEAPAVVDPASDAFQSSLGASLLDAGDLDALALRRAERVCRQSGKRLDVVLAELGLVPEDRLAAALAAQCGLTLASRSELATVEAIDCGADAAFLRARRLLPLADATDRLVVAVADPFDRTAIDALAFLVERPIERRLATAAEIDQALERLFGADGKPRAATLDIAPAAVATATEEDVRRLEDRASDAPTIRLVQELIQRAVETRASDIHIEPRIDSVRVRLRIDGVLHTIERLPVEAGPALTSRVKVLARLDIAERRLPQDGRIKSVVRGREIDMRVSTMPTLTGESAVLRILDRSQVRLDYGALGFAPGLVEGINRLMRLPHGIVLVTGPTGSGKTTTLYTALGSLDAEAAKIFTVEDPIEYQLASINQIQVHARIGLGFPTALRSILRQDPDVIMVGEIRDLETAQIAIQASLTGHLVLSTVHTNSAAATVTRLVDMGIESWLLASSLSGVLAQRLVRKLCDHCAVPAEPSAELRRRLDSDASCAAIAPGALRLRRRVGCPQCRNTGYDGRAAIGELLVVTDAVRDIVHAGGSDRAVEEAAVRGGMTSLYHDGLAKVIAGETTFEEVLRVTQLG